jgi:hypothetical protein
MSRLFKNTSEAHHQLAQAIDFRQLPDRRECQVACIESWHGPLLQWHLGQPDQMT